MKLSNLMVDTKSAWIEFPGCEGFEVELVNLARQELIALRKKHVTTKFNRSTRQPEEKLDEDKFIAAFTKATVKNWRGLKLKYLEELLLVDISKQDPESELEFSDEDAITLVKNSSEFDTWINDSVFDLDNFRTKSDRGNVESPGQVAE